MPKKNPRLPLRGTSGQAESPVYLWERSLTPMSVPGKRSVSISVEGGTGGWLNQTGRPRKARKRRRHRAKSIELRDENGDEKG